MTAKYNREENGRRYYLERLDKTSLTYGETMDFRIECPDGTFISPPHPDPNNPTTSWRWSETTVRERRSELEFLREKKTKEWRVYTRTWEPMEGVTPRSLLVEKDFGRNRDGTQELDSILGPKVFNNPKPTKLLTHLLQMGAADKDALILDSFAGSGSTGHAVLKLNAQDGGKRRFILCETMDYAQTITAERVRRVVSGYGEGTKATGGTGGGFDYFTIGEPMFLPDGNLNEAVGTEAIRGYVAYSEGIPVDDRATPQNPHSPSLLGLNRDTAWIFHYEPDRATSLDLDFLASLQFGGNTGASKPATVIIYADRCLLSPIFMTKHGIIFKKIPRDITRF